MALMRKAREPLGLPTKEKQQSTDSAAFAGGTPTDDLADSAAATNTDTAGTAPPEGAPAPTPGWWSRRQERKKLEGTLESYPHLLALKPREKIVFRSDYLEVDQSVACVLAFFHDDAAHDNFAAFWGIDRIPDGLDERVTAVLLEQVTRLDDRWIDQFTKQSEKLDRLDATEQAETGTTSSRRKAAKISGDLEVTIAEVQDGASYLSVHHRLLLKAPDLATLDDSVDRVTRLYIDRFGTLKAAAYHGEQRQELSALWKNNDRKRGRGFHFTSTEFAGSYSLVTNGLNDRGGEYVGYMVGDVNNSAVLMDVNDYDHHVVVADQSLSAYLDRERVASLWCSKLSQAALLGNGRVVHLVLDGADLDKLGPRFAGLTSRVDLNTGEVNMFELFGEESDELAVYSAHIEKLKLMFEQLFESPDGAVASIIRSQLEAIATDFYVEQGMWQHNAQQQRHRLRVVNIPHHQVPRLQMFSSYLETAHKTVTHAEKADPDQLRALGVLKGIATTMLATNGDLFNNHTADAVDGVRDSRRVVYDFSRLLRRGRGVAMAQLVNIVGFAVGTLTVGDTVIIHGTEHIDDRVKGYLTSQFERLHERGGRVVYSYNDVDKMLGDSAFNTFDAADYTLLGWMRDRTVAEYQKQLHQRIPTDLAGLIKLKGQNLTYLRRGMSNVVFHLDLALGINPYREAERRRVRRQSAKADEAARLDRIMQDTPVAGAHLTSARTTDERPGSDRQSAPGAADGRKRRGPVGTEARQPDRAAPRRTLVTR